MSMEYRCLHYDHLVLGDTALVLAYITDFYEPYDLSNYLDAHGNSSFVKFSKSSVNLPVGFEFKLVFRVLESHGDYGLVMIDNITITSGLCVLCSPNEFLCSPYRDECIPIYKVCDFEPDCLGGEDENNCDFEILEAICKDCNTSRGNTDILDNGGTNDQEACASNAFSSNSWKTTDFCSNCATNDSMYSCPTNCTSSGLSFTCTTGDVPVYATSITVFGLMQDSLEFNDSFSNLEEINVIDSKLNMLQITSDVRLQILTISNSTIDIVYIGDRFNYLRFVRIFNCTFVEFNFSPEWVHSFEFFVHKSIVYNPKRLNILEGVHADLSETWGFPFMVAVFEHTIVNLSFCNLDVQPLAFTMTVTLDLSHNNLSTWHYISFVQNLHLQNNNIEEIRFTRDLRQSEARLIYLDLSDNYITVIDGYDFSDFPNLLYLKLSNNRISEIHENAFSFVSKLHLLDLSSNHLHSVKLKLFISLSSLQYLYLQNNFIKVVEEMFDGLISIEHLRVDSYTLCCAQPKTVGKIQCTAPVNDISSCNNLIDTPLLSTLIWYIALLAVFGNLFGPFYRGFNLKSRSLSSFVIYSTNLSIADFLMGVYLYIIAGANLRFSGRYGFEDEGWRHSHICTVAGVLATLSSEASALFVLLITIDRIIIIRDPLSSLQRSNLVSKIMTGTVWTLSFFLSLLPLFGSEYFENYYSSSGICISLPLSVYRKPGWEYSMALFVGANFLIFIAIFVGQLVIFATVVRMGVNVNSSHSAQRRREINLAKTLVAVAITDMLCWIPVGVIGLLTFKGTDVTAQVYAWVIVVVLPINSALNPMIYTFSEILRRRGKAYKNEHLQQRTISSSTCTKEDQNLGEINQVSLVDEGTSGQSEDCMTPSPERPEALAEEYM
ncbi:G-protein coupled receptor GRL101 [Magallana gigas]|uniref:G-protein coupled receptor GRL101 n=1 Tax=Magallana gigas TaxID=29159 RepID=UPI003341F0DE